MKKYRSIEPGFFQDSRHSKEIPDSVSIICIYNDTIQIRMIFDDLLNPRMNQHGNGGSWIRTAESGHHWKRKHDIPDGIGSHNTYTANLIHE
jgi:hypothetical protein